jgi:23S rRNA (uridine2552-2'-O)-methyltransferase
VDLLPMQPVAGVAFVHGDVRETAVQATISGHLEGAAVDLVLSDMAPNLTGIAAVDEASSQTLVSVSLACAERVLKPGGCLLVKVFHGCGLDVVIREMRGAFADVSIRKPAASRSRSSEVYVLCRGLLR